ncbi:rho GTPase-activating protein 25-like [Carcharodon carcharias]|uniref:rho GTPase-activating protein 25-like n=1 Tax=Carcharodon carcharias TaxID=13397 RepID=UPI001B7F0715|nr:rho GTPase-activating protein 25-like [Carcharodon carcharias]
MWVGRHLNRLNREPNYTQDKCLQLEDKRSPFQKRESMSLKLPRNVWDFNLKDGGRIGRSKSVMPTDHGTALNRASSPNTMERPVKSGWLKKRRSLMKQWQSRWFVLRGVYLCYYKEEEDGKPQGCILLKDIKVNEVPSNPEDPGKFLFEITPVGCSDQDWIGSGYDTQLLMANSQNEMKDWVKAIRRTLGTSSGAVFDQRLAETMAYEQKFGKHPVPMIVEQCADFIRQHGLNEEGIFRLPGQDNQVKELRDAFDSGERPTFDRDTDVHTVASLFKLYLRELPEPVIPWSQYDNFLACCQLMSSNEEEGRKELMTQLSLLPQVNCNLLSYICRFLHEVQLNSSINKMSVDNLATVFGVNLLRPKIEDPVAIMRGTPQVQKLMTILISSHDELFPKHEDKPPSPLRISAQRSMVGWGAAEFATGVATRTHRRCQNDGNDNSMPEESELENWMESPRKRTQTLPARKCTEISDSVNEGIPSTQNWNTKSSQVRNDKEAVTEGHRRCLSQDILRASASYQLLCTSETSPTATSAASSQDKDGSAARSPSPSLDMVSHQTANSLLQTSQSLTAKTQQEKAELDSGGEESEAKVGEMSKEQLLKLIAKLREEFHSKRESYVERIESLEKENYEVWSKVVRLNKQIEENKKQFEALEIRFRNAFRAQMDAERRNQELEEELKGFFQTEKENDRS